MKRPSFVPAGGSPLDESALSGHIVGMSLMITHLIDAHCSEDAARLASVLMRLFPSSRVVQRLIVLGRQPSCLRIPEGLPVTRVPLRFDWAALSLPALRSELLRHQPRVLHAAGAGALAAAGMLRRIGASVPVVGTLTDPGEARKAGRWWRSLGAQGLELLCSSSIVQRRLVESGIPTTSTAVVRPAIDFGEIRQARETCTREQLGLPVHGPVLVMPSPATREGGQFIGVWAVAILHQLWPSLRLVIPGCSRETDRIRRMTRGIYCPEAFVFTGERYSPAQLLTLCDAMLAPAVDDIPTGWLAAAMGAGVPVIGSAIPSITELIADRHNGFLCRAGQPHTLAIRIRTVFESPDVMRQCAEVARGHAFDVFRAQQCVEQYMKAFEALADSRRAVAAVHDAAVAI